IVVFDMDLGAGQRRQPRRRQHRRAQHVPGDDPPRRLDVGKTDLAVGQGHRAASIIWRSVKSFAETKDTRVGTKVMRKFATLLLALIVLGAAQAPVQAEDAYPTRPVKIMIAFPVGGLLDTVSRIVGERLSSLLGQQFIVEARPGAGGTLATAAVAKSDPDG